MAQACGERGACGLSCEVVQQFTCRDEACRVAIDDSVMREVFGEHSLACSVLSDDEHVCRLGDEVEREELVDELTVDLARE